MLKGRGFESRHNILDGHDIFHIDLLQKLYWLFEKTKNKRKSQCLHKWSITVADGWIRTNTHSLELEATKLNIYALLSQNFICILTTNIAINTYGSLMFGLDGFPDWAMEAAAESNVNCTNPLL